MVGAQASVTYDFQTAAMLEAFVEMACHWGAWQHVLMRVAMLPTF